MAPLVGVALALAVWAAPALNAQDGGYQVLGQAYIAGSQGEHFGVPGAKLELHSVSLEETDGTHDGAPPTAEADSLGLFRFEGLAEGCYFLAGTSAGVSGQSDLFCLPAEEEPLRMDLELEVEAVVETVEVTATVIEIDATETTSSGSVGVSTIYNAPKANRSVEDVMPLIPGVLRGPGRGDQHEWRARHAERFAVQQHRCDRSRGENVRNDASAQRGLKY